MIKAIDYFGYDSPFLRIKTHFSILARRKMYRRFVEICRPRPTDRVLDLGVTPDERLADSNLFEKLYPWKGQITAASLEDCSNIARRYGLNRFVCTRAGEPLPFGDRDFDILYCSAVLEHVGTREEQKAFLAECLRVADRVFLTTPNRAFPVEMHTFLPFVHWLPWPWFQKIAAPIHNGFWSDIHNLNILSRRDLRAMSDEIEIGAVRIWGMRSNLLVTRSISPRARDDRNGL